MRSIFCVLVLSATFLACGAEPGGLPVTPSVEVPEAGAPSTPATPATPSAPDASAPKK